MDTAKLKRLAKAATPGPWMHCPSADSNPYSGKLHDHSVYYVEPGAFSPGSRIAETMTCGSWAHSNKTAKANAAYIAACDPRTVLALIDENTSLRETCAEAYQACGALGANVKVLDNLSAQSRGLPRVHEEALPQEVSVEVELRAEIERLRAALIDVPYLLERVESALNDWQVEQEANHPESVDGWLLIEQVQQARAALEAAK